MRRLLPTEINQTVWNQKTRDTVNLLVDDFNARTPLNGATGARPTDPAPGRYFFDETLGKPIWFKGPGWVDATGAAV